jgi:hypothetical protein
LRLWPMRLHCSRPPPQIPPCNWRQQGESRHLRPRLHGVPGSPRHHRLPAGAAGPEDGRVGQRDRPPVPRRWLLRSSPRPARLGCTSRRRRGRSVPAVLVSHNRTALRAAKSTRTAEPAPGESFATTVVCGTRKPSGGGLATSTRWRPLNSPSCERDAKR